MSRLTNAEKDLEYATRFVRPILSMVGAWPLSADSSFASKLLQRTEHVLTYFVFLVMLVPCLLNVLLHEKNGKVKLKLMGPIINCGTQIFQYTILLYRMNEIQIGLTDIRQDLMNASDENRSIFREKAKIGRRVVLIVAATMYGGGLCYRLILPLLRGTIVTPDNVTIRPLPCPGYFPFMDEYRTPNYEILFTLQVMAGFATYAVTSGSCGVSALLVLHACCMLRILVNKMKKLVDKTNHNDNMVQRRIVDIVEYQMKILRFLQNTETVTEYICLIGILSGTCLICVVGCSMLMEWENHNATLIVAYTMLLTSCTFCVFIFCYIGQLLVDENEIVGETSCTVNWYRLPTEHARCMILIIAMSNYPMKLTAGRMLEMSLATFTDVMKMSMAYLNILRKVVLV